MSEFKADTVVIVGKSQLQSELANRLGTDCKVICVVSEDYAETWSKCQGEYLVIDCAEKSSNKITNLPTLPDMQVFKPQKMGQSKFHK